MSNPLVLVSLLFLSFLCVRSSKQTNMCVRKTVSLHTIRRRERTLNAQTTLKMVQRGIFVYGGKESSVCRLSILP